MPDFPDWINTLKKLHLKRKGNRPKVAPQKFYPSQVELQTQELIREELGEYGYRLADAAAKGGVQAVYDVPGAVPQGFDEKVQRVAEAVSLFQVRAFANFSELAVGERYFPGGNEQRDIILNTWSDNFVNLCKSTNEEMRKKVAGVVSDGVLGGRNIRDLTKDIQNTCSEFTRNKAELIATTEVGKLNTAIARNQSEAAGIQFYEWSAAMDGRTRESHAVMDGKICKWGDDTGFYVWKEQPDGKRKLVRQDRPKNAYMGAPGTDFRCRCTALPYVPEYEDDYEAEREKGPVQGVTQGKHTDPDTVEYLNELKDKEKNEKIQRTLSRSFAFLKERNKSLKEKPIYIPYDKYRSIYVDLKRHEKYIDALKSGRQRKEGDEIDKFEKETRMAEIIRDIGFGSVLVEENGSTGKSQPDAVVDGKVAEFKQVDGAVGRVSDRVRDAIHQGAKIICLNITKNHPFKAVLDRIKARTRNHKGVDVIFKLDGKVYRYREE